MSNRPARRFRLADLMVVVAGAAVGMMFSRAVSRNASPFDPNSTEWILKIRSAPFVVMVPVVLLILRWMPPRPSSRRIFRQPGTLACAVSLFMLVQSDLMLLSKGTLIPYLGGRRTFYPVYSYATYVYWTGLPIALVWIYLACARLWKSEASWIDRAGRIFGALMITIFLIEYFGF